MGTHLAAVFWSFLLFEAKHFVCDFVLQTRYQLLNKGSYGHPAGLVHAGTHAIGSLPALVALTHSPPFISMLLIGEFLVHYHTDWLKEQINQRLALSYEHSLFWLVFGADQLVHQLTYLFMIVVVST